MTDYIYQSTTVINSAQFFKDNFSTQTLQGHESTVILLGHYRDMLKESYWSGVNDTILVVVVIAFILAFLWWFFSPKEG